MTNESRVAMPTDDRYSRENTLDSCGKAETANDPVSITVNGSPSNSPSNSLDRSLCGSLGTDELACCADYSSASVVDPDEQALLEKLQHANRLVVCR